MKKIIYIINGPNLNLLGHRETHIYGKETLESFLQKIRKKNLFSDLEFIYNQSNHEGVIIDFLQKFAKNIQGIILNAGAFTHTSLAIADTIRNISIPVIEIHISNIYAREKIRHYSLISSVCQGCICGFGLKSLELALISFLDQNK